MDIKVTTEGEQKKKLYDELRADSEERAERYKELCSQLNAVTSGFTDLINETPDGSGASAMHMLQFVSTILAGRAGIFGGFAAISAGVNPALVYSTLQQQTLSGLRHAVELHNVDCSDPSACTTGTRLAEFVQTTSQVICDALRVVAELENPSPAKSSLTH